MPKASFAFEKIESLFTKDEKGATKAPFIDIPCPFCSAVRSEEKQKFPIFRVWWIREDFLTYYCIHCGEKGSLARYGAALPVNFENLEKARLEASQRDIALRRERLDKARAIWRMAIPIDGTLAEQYLRNVRGIQCAIPATIRFRPARRLNGYRPAMIAAHGLPVEHEPGKLSIKESGVFGIQFTFLAADGGGKAPNKDGLSKISIGYSRGWPIVLAPPNDGQALAICEGVEDALSIFEATGMGAWASTGAKKLAALAHAVPSWIEAVSIIVDDDDDGRTGAKSLSAALDDHGCEISLNFLSSNIERKAA